MARYVTEAELIGRLEKVGLTTGYEDALIESVCEATCDWVDAYTQRRFDLAAVASARRFSPVGGMLRVDDIADLTGLLVETGSPGAYTTTATVDIDFYTDPSSAISYGKPVTALYGTWPGGRDAVQVTALWGWPVVPWGVQQAAMIQAHALYRRKDSPEGVAGLDGYGPIRVSRFADSTAMLLLNEFRRTQVLVA